MTTWEALLDVDVQLWAWAVVAPLLALLAVVFWRSIWGEALEDRRRMRRRIAQWSADYRPGGWADTLDCCRPQGRGRVLRGPWRRST